MADTLTDERAVQLNVLWTGKLADVSVIRRGHRPRFSFEQMKRGHFRPKGVSRSNMIYVRLHALRMLRIYRRYDKVEMTDEERKQFELAVIRYKGRPSSESFALAALDARRIESKVDKVITLLEDKVLPALGIPKP